MNVDGSRAQEEPRPMPRQSADGEDCSPFTGELDESADTH